MPFATTWKLPTATVLLGLALAGGCAHAEHPRLQNPTHIESFCGFRVPRPSAILSILTSVGDQPPADPAPALRELRSRARATSGAIAHWDQPQPFELPNFAHTFGESGPLVRIRAAAILHAPVEGQTRPVSVEVRDHGAWRWVDMRAYDLQDVCTEGQRSF